MMDKLSIIWKDGKIEKIVNVDLLFKEDGKDDLAVLFPIPNESSVKLPQFPGGPGGNINPRVDLRLERRINAILSCAKQHAPPSP